MIEHHRQHVPEMRMRTHGYLFRWMGGPYIEVSCRPDGTPGVPLDVINVWDYERDAPRIAVTLAAFSTEVYHWLFSREDDARCHCDICDGRSAE